MVRTYKPKTNRNKIDEDVIKTAISEVASKTLSLRSAANKYNIAVSTLQHRIEKFKNGVENPALSRGEYASKYTVAQVFNIEQEQKLSEYLIKCSKMHFGLTLKQTMVLAYEYAEHLQCKYPESWKRNGFAGKDWVLGFRKRNESISLRKPENTSAARAFAFNKTAVTEFFNNYERVLTKHKFTPDRIINLDETGISTVLPTPKILGDKSQRQVSQVVSAERGELVTFCGIVTAIGSAVPPVFVFPRVHYKDHFLNGAPEGSLGLSNKSGWMTSDLHIQVLKHIQRHSLCTVDNPILVICDNHESHISIEAVNYCRSNGIVYLSLPPHTSHKLQPLDVSIFGPFKGKLKIAFNDWHTRNVGKTLTIHNIAELTKTAFLEAFNPRNISSGFSKPGIWPFNRLAFSDEDYAPIEIYNATSEEIAAASNQNTQETTFVNLNNSMQDEENVHPPQPTNSDDPLSASCQSKQNSDLQLNAEATPAAALASSSITIMSPEVIRPYPKKSSQTQQEKTGVRKGREKGKSRVYSDTPEKNRLQELHDEKVKKQELKAMRQKAKEINTARKLLGLAKTSKTATKKRRTSLPDHDSDSSQTSIKLSDDESVDVTSDHDDFHLNLDPVNINVNDFLLVKFAKKKSVIYYVANVTKKHNLTEYQVLYLRKKPGSWIFVFPAVEDKATVDFSDVVLHLPKPILTKGTSRTSGLYKFSIDLSQYNVQ